MCSALFVARSLAKYKYRPVPSISGYLLAHYTPFLFFALRLYICVRHSYSYVWGSSQYGNTAIDNTAVWCPSIASIHPLALDHRRSLRIMPVFDSACAYIDIVGWNWGLWLCLGGFIVGYYIFWGYKYSTFGNVRLSAYMCLLTVCHQRWKMWLHVTDLVSSLC